MQNILYNISQVIGVAIIHSLWQGLLVFLLLRLVLLFLPALSAKSKYNLAITALIVITGWFVCTLSNEINSYTWVTLDTKGQEALPTAFGIPLYVHHDASYSSRYNYTIEGLLPYITLLYIAGLIFNTGQLVWARKKLGSIRQTMSIDVQLQLKVDQFVSMLDIKDNVRFGLSKLVDSPCMMGYFKPVILLPFTLSTYLSAEEIEIIILHELAHIKRNDYLVNLAQQAMSVLLFFNPFAQLINRTINQERENSCDDIVIEATQKPLVYAHALLKLEQTRHQEWQLALAATGKKYHLLNRIERIMKTKKPIGNGRHILLSMALLTASITGLAWLNPTIANGKISINKTKPAIIAELFGDTTAHKKSTKATIARKSAKNHTTTIYKNGKSYTYNNDHDYNDPQLEKLSAEVSRYGEEISKYYESPAFKKYQDDMEAKGKAIQDFYDKPELKDIQDKMERLSTDFQKNWGDNSETEKLSSQMEADGKKIEQYYNSEEFKKFNEPLEKKYGIQHDGYQDRDSENYKKYHQEVDAHVPAEIKQATQDLRKMGAQMRERYHSPEYVKQRETMRAMGDSMRKAFHNPAIKEQQAEMRKLGEQMRAMQNSPEIKNIKQQMRIAQTKMRAYMNSPEFKKRMNEWRKYSYHYDWNWDEHSDKPEKPEAPEKSDAPEKADSTSNN